MENILIVDSHQEYAHYLKAHLAEEGYHLAVAFSGAEAIEKIQFTIFILIFLDLKVEMAQIKAMEFLEHIKRLYPEIPVIMIRESIQDVSPTCVNEARIKEFFLNIIVNAIEIIVNAIEAMPQGGELRVSARNFSPDNSRQKYVVVKFIDTGVGIPQKIQKKIFEHFLRPGNQAQVLD
jgi:signal transduction histidine kinase